ncbi:hypothetical protein ACFL51_00995 [Myxococcota bacterium]
MKKSIVLSLVLVFVSGGLGCKKAGSDQDRAPRDSGAAARQRPAPSANHLGEPFTAKAVTDLARVATQPEEYMGKTVRIRGVVVTHCHHRRGWFALATQGKKRQVIWVLTRPRFLVPSDVEHGVTVAEAEGQVGIRTVPEQRARHFAGEHGLFGGVPDAVRGPQKLVQLTATGAQF